MYKVRNKTTGLFSSGGAYPRWTRTGKVWHQRHHLRSHLRSNARHKVEFYADAEVVEYVMKADAISILTMQEV